MAIPKLLPPAIVVAEGPRDAERLLLAMVGDHLPQSPSELLSPVRIVVPSRSLRRHVLRVLVGRFGAAVGVVVQTHRAVALEVLERGGVEAPAGGTQLQDLLVRVLAARENTLEAEFGRYDDGLGLVAGAVRDLLDAGYTHESLEAVMESVSAARLGEVDRVQAVLRVASGVQMGCDAGRWSRRGVMHTLAKETLASQGAAVLPSRAIVIYGFAETTGLLADFLETMVRALGAVAVLDHPRDPSQPGERDQGWVFTHRLVDRLAGPGSAESLDWSKRDDAAPEVSAFSAPGPEAEVREIASRIRAVREMGTPWEDIGVVLRSLDEATVVAVRRHFNRLGIPFSGEGATASGGEPARRSAAFAELLAAGSDARTEVWLGAQLGGDRLSRQELDLALRAAGVARLADVASLEESNHDIRLPVVDRLDEVDGRLRRRCRVLAGGILSKAVCRARRLVAVLDSRPEEASVGDLLSWVAQVSALMGDDADGVVDPVQRAVEALEGDVSGGLVVAWRDLHPILVRELERLDPLALGGDGGGVQVLSVMEARGRTFEHLFLAGLNRGLFPARPVEEPVLSTAARRAIAATLPDLPLKTRDSEEERYLFAQLMTAAPSVTLSWRRVDADGKESNPSVFLERLRLADVLWWSRGEDEKPGPGCAVACDAPDIFGDRDAADPRPALEYAVASGLVSRSAAFGPALTELSGGRAMHYMSVLEELDPSTPRCDLGPFLGVVGLRPPSAVWVTRIEQVAACPWQAFLERELGLEPPPEASFAEEGISGRVAGQVLHQVLEAIATRQGVSAGETLDEVRGRPDRKIRWPDVATLELMVEETAERVAWQEGVSALAPAIAAYVRPLLDRARDLAWPQGEATVLGAETWGSHRLGWIGRDGGQRELDLRFRADRVDRADDGEGLVVVDFKTGGVAQARPATVLPRGQLLQGAAYALAAGEGAVGRYISVADPEKLTGGPVVEIDHTLAGELEPCVGIILGSWDDGVQFPRVSTPSGGAKGRACGWCRVKAACLLGEPGVKGRLIEAFASMDGDAALRLMWNLPDRKAEG